MTDSELYQLVHDETVNNPDSPLSNFEPWRITDIYEISSRYSISVATIISDLANNHIDPEDDIIVLDGESIYSTTIKSWANDVRDFLFQPMYYLYVPTSQIENHFKKNQALYDPENRNLYIPMIENDRISGIELAHFKESDETLLSYIDDGLIADDSLVVMAWDSMPAPETGKENATGKRTVYNVSSDKDLQSFISGLGQQDGLSRLIPEYAILNVLRLKSFQNLVNHADSVLHASESAQR